MKIKLCLIFCVIFNSFFSDSLLAQLLKNKLKKSTLNFNKVNVYHTLINCAHDTIFFIRDNHALINPNFQNEVNFSASKFQNTSNFSRSQFQDKTDFSDSQFQDTASFSDSQFKRIVDFSGSRFKSIADFSNAKFQNTASFIRSRFYKEESFIKSQFKKEVDFSHSKFLNDANFSSSQFQNFTDFSYVSFQEKVNFDSTSFRKEVNFSDLFISDSTFFDFSSSKLPDLINFSNNRIIHNDIDFTTANFGQSKLYTISGRKWHYINLYNSDIAKIKIDYQHFRLCFYSLNGIQEDDNSNLAIEVSPFQDFFVYDKKRYSFTDTSLVQQLLEIRNFQDYLKQIFPSGKMTDTVVRSFLLFCIENRKFPNALSNDEIISTYERVLKRFDANGQKLSYEALDVEYKDFKNGRFIFPHIWYCYGYHKEWIFEWTVGFLLFFTIITYFFIDRLNGTRNQNGVYFIVKSPPAIQSKIFSSKLSRLWYSFIYTSTIFFLFSLKIENINFKKTGVLYVMLVYFVGLICLGYIANFVLQK